MKPVTLRIAQPLYDELHSHLFPGDHDEHGAVIAAGVAESPRGTRLLARQLFLARDGVDYVPGRHGYRALTADFVARVSDYCARERLSYLAVHCHGGDDSVDFSPTDLASHQRGYPALLDITDGGPVGALVFAHTAVAGEIWTREGICALEHAVVVGQNLRWLHAKPPPPSAGCGSEYHRQSLLFGAVGQARLSRMKVGIIGLGGVGSLVNEWFAHLGVGEVVGVDPERIEPSNRPRLVGSRPRDSMDFLAMSRWSWMRRLGELLALPKVAIARRVARHANPRGTFHGIIGDVTDRKTAMRLADADFLFLCADSARSRLVFNALVHQYLVPGVQIGSKVPVRHGTGDVGDIFVVARPVLPYSGGGCLSCNELIPADQLQRELLTPDERRRQNYGLDEHVAAPSVITLNAIAAAQAVNEFLLGTMGLLHTDAIAGYRLGYPRERRWMPVDCRYDASCPHCGGASNSVFGRGDRAELPCRSTASR